MSRIKDGTRFPRAFQIYNFLILLFLFITSQKVHQSPARAGDSDSFTGQGMLITEHALW